MFFKIFTVESATNKNKNSITGKQVSQQSKNTPQTRHIMSDYVGSSYEYQ